MPSDPAPTPRPVPPELLQGDLIGPDSPLFGIIWINPARMSGAPCFYGTRVPVQHLFDYLRGGHSIDYFLDGFPGVTRQQVDAVLEIASRAFGPTESSLRPAVVPVLQG